MPVPAADPNAVARMQKEQLYEKQHTMLRLPMEALKSNPDMATAAHEGQPNLNPPDDAVSATDVLNPGAAGPSFNLAARMPVDSSDSGSMNNDASPPVEAVPIASSGAGGTDVGVQIIAAPASADAAASMESSSSSSASPSAAAASPQPAEQEPPASAPTIDGVLPPPGAAAVSSSQNGTADSSSSTQGTTGNNGDQSTTPPGPSKVDPNTESTSKKKKKGLHKLVPF
jgi:hypothetical protein